MPSLPAAQIENAVLALQPCTTDQQVHFLDGIAVVFEHIAISFKIERVKRGAPPIRWQMVFEVGNRTQSAGTVPPSHAGLGTVRRGRAARRSPQGDTLSAHTLS